MNKGLVWTIVVVIALVIIGIFAFGGSEETNTNVNSGDSIEADSGDVVDSGDEGGSEAESSDEGEDDSMDDGMGEPDVTFVMTGENFKFVMTGEDNPDLVVSEGDLVRVEFTSTSGFHDWVVDEFDAATEKVRDGEDGMTYVEFVADQAGEFEYYCSVGQHRANGMKGMLIVQ